MRTERANDLVVGVEIQVSRQPIALTPPTIFTGGYAHAINATQLNAQNNCTNTAIPSSLQLNDKTDQSYWLKRSLSLILEN